MFAGFLIGFRETFEAALIIGILSIYLKKTGHTRHNKYLWYGAFAGILLSLLLGLIPNLLDSIFAGINKNVFNAIILYSAVSVMTWMIFWMQSNSKGIKEELEGQMSFAIENGNLYSLAFLSFLGVFREGLETVLFMWGVIVSSSFGSTFQALAGCFAGGILAFLFGWAFFHKLLGSFNLKTFFQASSFVLMIIAAGLFTKATGKLIRADIISPIISQLWDTSWILSEKGILGKIVSGMTGYISKPSLAEVISYSSYVVLMTTMIFGKQISNLISPPSNSEFSEGK